MTVRKVYTLAGKKGETQSILVSNDIAYDYVQAEWGYATRYGADGLDLPNFGKSIEIIKERHPDWEFVDYLQVVGYNPKNVSPK